MPDPIGR
ncbi:hypothetical protein D021_2442A, partial [Vibrio parahaemolyticus 10296]